MSKEIANTHAADEWRNKVELWKRTFMKGASDDEMLMFEAICKRTGLSPELKQIYPVPREDWKTKKTTFSFQTSIDGYRLIADRTGRYTPGREPTFTYTPEGKLVSATAYVKKMTADGTWHEVAASAFYDEYVQTFKDRESGKQEPTKFWKQMQHNQLAKCAEALCLRKAFPGDLSSLYTVDEMAQTSNIEDTEAAIEVQEEAGEELMVEFKAKFKSIENMDYDLGDFINHVSKKSGKGSADTVKQALKSDKFSKSYLKWVEEKVAAEPKSIAIQQDLLNAAEA